MSYFSTKHPFFIPSYGIDVKETQKMDKFLKLIERSGALELIKEDNEKEINKGGRPEYNRYDLLAAIIYCFAFGNGSLRNIEEQCKFDLRLIYIMNNYQPKHSIIGKFINDYILPVADKLFSLITKEILRECQIEIDDAFIDGTKFEADSNKYKFVWKPTTFHQKLTQKVIDLLKRYNLERGISEKNLITSKEIALKITELSNLKSVLDEDMNLLSEYLTKCLEYEEKERICGPERNSYYKTDYDATAMCLKEDYYSGLGSNMHAGYNVQIMVSKGIILSYLTTQSRNDLKDFIPLLDKNYKNYGFYPKNIAADSGYGSLENYEYLKNHDIGNYVKYFSWEGNVSGRNPTIYKLNDETITCLNSKVGYKIEIQNRHARKPNTYFYKVVGCKKCLYSKYCKRFQKIKSENFKIFEINPILQTYIQQSEENLLSIKGIEMRVNRSAQVEGAFGVIKQDSNYERFRRTSILKVNLEFMLVALGYNIRKLFRYYDGKAQFRYWVAPLDLKPESFKKPSAKRLSTRASKKKEKSVNERSKQYKYK